MKNTFYIPFVLLFLNVFPVFGQQTHWAHKLERVSSEYSSYRHSGREVLGVPNVATDGRSSIYAWAVKPNTIYREGAETAFIEVAYKNEIKNARQVAVFESYNPGAISEIWVRSHSIWHRVFLDTAVIARTGYLMFKQDLNDFESLSDTLGSIKRKWWNIFKKDTLFQAQTSYRILRKTFEPKDVDAVRLVLNLFAIDGWNQIDAIGLSASEEPIKRPRVKVVNQDLLRCSKRRNLGYTVNSPASEIAPVVSADGQRLYFSRTNHPGNNAAYTQDIWSTSMDTITREVFCTRKTSRVFKEKNWSNALPFKLPKNNIIPNTLAGFSDNGKYMYLYNLYGPVEENGNCDTVLTRATHGLSVCRLDTTFWDEAGINDLEQLDSSVTNHYENFFKYPGKELLICNKKNENDTDNQLFYLYLDENKEWINLIKFGTGTGNFQLQLPIHMGGEHLKICYNILGEQKRECFTPAWSQPQKVEIENFSNTSNYINFHITPVDTVMFISMKDKLSRGNRDIYVSFRKDVTKWSTPKNIGIPVNTLSDDCTPFLDDDNYTLFFSSAGHKGYGDRDIYMTKRLDNSWMKWTKPRNLGDSVNSPGSDAFFTISYNTRNAFFASNEHPNSCKHSDIFGLQMTRLIVLKISGKVLNVDNNRPLKAVVWFNNLDEDKQLGFRKMRFYSDFRTGEYHVDLYEMIDGLKMYNYALIAQKHGWVMTDSTGNLINWDETDLHNLKRTITVRKNLYLKRSDEQPVVEVDVFEDEPDKPVEDTKVQDLEYEQEIAEDPADKGKKPVDMITRPLLDSTSYCGVAFIEGNVYKTEKMQGDYVEGKLLDEVYSKYFEYNQTNIQLTEQGFQNVTATIKEHAKKLESDEKIFVYVASSASKVPAYSNERLAFQRGNEAISRIKQFMKNNNIPFEKVEFTNQHQVQGKEFEQDAEENRELYKQYQYVKVWIYVCKKMK